jgi:hypothetical protein
MIAWGPDVGPWSMLPLRAPLRETQAGLRKRRFIHDSLDFSGRDVVTLGTGVQELLGEIRYADDPYALLTMLTAGADGNTLYYHPKNLLRYSNMTLNPVLEVAQGWVGSTSGAGLLATTYTQEDTAQKMTIGGSTAAANLYLSQVLYGVAGGDVVSLSVDYRISGASIAAGFVWQWRDANGNQLGANGTNYTGTATGYTRYAVANVTAPAGATSLKVYLTLRTTTSGGSGSVWFRNPQVEKGSVNSAYVNTFSSLLIEPNGDLIEALQDHDRALLKEYMQTVRLRITGSTGNFTGVV